MYNGRLSLSNLRFSPNEGGGTAETTSATETTSTAPEDTTSTETQTATETTSAEKGKSGKDEDNSTIRAIRKQLDDLRKENDGYKRRQEDERKAKLTEEQRLKEEHAAAIAEVEKLRGERMRDKIAAEFKLPDSLAARLIGTDEESLRADAEELAKLVARPKAGTNNNPANGTGNKRVYKASELNDRKFYLANEKDIMAAYQEGRILANQ